MATLAEMKEARAALLRGIDWENRAAQAAQLAQEAFEAAGAMKATGRERAAVQSKRMLPQHERATDVRTNTFKEVADAKADHLYYTAQAQMCAGMAAMEFSKVAALQAWAVLRKS